MASFSTAMNLKLNPNPSPCFQYLTTSRALFFSSDPGRSTRPEKITKVRAAAMKFKGTQMREQQLTEMIEQKVMEAKQVCGEDETSDECKVAWDEVEEVSQAKAHLRLRLEMDKKDPLESFCQENPETDECRIYED